MTIKFLILLMSVIISQALFAGSPFDSQKQILHFLNRLSFGPRPSEIQFYMKNNKEFKEHWLDEQMNPDKIDDSVLESKLHKIKSLDQEPKDNFNYYKKPEELARELNLAVDEMDTKKDIRKEVKELIGNDRFPDALIVEMQAQKLIRAVESKKQLQEVLVDFWYNYFNVDAGKNEIKYFAYDYENNVIRKNVFKSFKDMLIASAHHPAMLVYLDNRLSKANAINENYAREIMELHTLGVDGGYTQKDVQELARILTGWTTKELKIEPQFIFKKGIHDKEEKNWLGTNFPAGGGEDEGDRAIEILATHPKTAAHVCKRLVSHFFNDSPEESVLKNCQQKFISSKGNFKEIYSALFLSPEFNSPKNFKVKIKKPFHLVASSIRALGGEVIKPMEIIKATKNMGEELYRCPPPTGYKDDASSWVNPGAMISRLQFALDLTSQNLEGILTTNSAINPKLNLENQIKQTVLSLGLDQLSPSSSKIIAHELENEPLLFAANEIRPSFISKLTGLVLGSPEFQRR